MSAPLDGVIVVALEQAIAAPLATRHLADLGATVIKIERRDGGDFARHYDANMAGNSTFFVWANRAKQSVALDLKDATDRSTFDGLVAGADVFIQNLAPGAAERLGVQAEQMVAIHPHLIACEISGYGLGGPRTNDKAYDLAIQAEAGAIALTGSAEAMSKVGFSVADISAAMYAFSSILASLYRRSVTGEGAAISLSMLECLTEWTSAHVYAAANTGMVPERRGHRHAMIAPYGIYSLADGQRVLLAVQSNPQFAVFTEAILHRPELAGDTRFVGNPERIANIDDLELIINEVFSSTPAPQILSRLAASDVVWARARSAPEVWNHEQLEARQRFITTPVPGGEATTLLPPFNISGAPDPAGAVPALGEHDEAMLQAVIARGESGRSPSPVSSDEDGEAESSADGRKASGASSRAGFGRPKK